MEFVYFGNDWFAENRTSSHHIANRLGARYPLLYVEVPGLRAPKANARDLRKLMKKLVLAFEAPELVGERMWRMTLPQIPLRRFKTVRALNQAFSRWRIGKAIRRLGFQQTVAWFHVPHPGFLAGKLGEGLTIFYCIDDYSMLPDVDGVAVKAMDDELTRAADLVFACNQPLADARRALNPNIVISPHGVDAELFARAQLAETKLPEATVGLRRPIVGSWGLIDQRVDLKILEYIARERPDWTVLLIGRVAVDVSALKSLQNVVLAGARPYNELPEWAKAIDVCVLPYIQTPLILQSSPLKLREYLAAGKAVVAVPLPETQMLGEAVKTAVDGPGFVRAIEEALATDTPELAAYRQQAIAGNTWDATFAGVLSKVTAEWERLHSK